MKTGLVLGFFDGVHIAHQTVISSAFEYADEVIVVTLKDSPAVFFGQKTEYILPRNKSIEKIKSIGVKDVIELDFTKIANESAEDYLKKLVNEYSPVSISTGFNHTFGKNRAGNSKFLAEHAGKYGYKYICVPPQKLNGEIISSTLIRNLLKSGKIQEANEALGSNFVLAGTVVKGAQLGRTIGFPTANINYPDGIVKIPYGVYSALVNNRHAVLNWGIKPTVNNTKQPVAEVHIINYKADLYGKNIEIEITDKIRDEKKFNNLEELKIQIKEDIQTCLR